MKPAKPDLQETLAIAEYSIRVGLGCYIRALIITYTSLGVPYYNYIKRFPKTPEELRPLY